MSEVKAGFFILRSDGALTYSGYLPESKQNFVQAWQYDPNNRSSAYSFLVEAAALGAFGPQIETLRQDWKIDNKDCMKFAERSNIVLEDKKGGWTATFEDKKDIKMLPRKSAFGALVELATRYPLLFRRGAIG